MSDLVVPAIIAAIPTTGTLVLAICQLAQGNKIHVLVNSKMTAALKELADAHAEIRSLKSKVESKK